MYGSPPAERFKAWLNRNDFVFPVSTGVLSLLLIVVFAALDISSFAQEKDQQAQESVLKGQLAEFLLGTREPDGSSLLENPHEFSTASRELNVLTLRRPFFTYFLTKNNARTFRVEDVRWEPPRSCVLEFAQEFPYDANSVVSGYPIQVCFSAVSADPTGRYIYFTLRYATDVIRRHKPGEPLSSSDSIKIYFSGARKFSLQLAFEAPAQGSLKKQAKRFEGVHEIAGFISDDGGRVTRMVSGQAFERRNDASLSEDQNFVTVVGRMDSSLLTVGDVAPGEWPSSTVKSYSIGVEVRSYDPASGNILVRGFSHGSRGTALASLERAYLAAVPSKAKLTVTSVPLSKSPHIVWTSEDAEFARRPAPDGLWQMFSDYLANKLGKSPTIHVQQQQVVGGMPPFVATLTDDGVGLPDVAARAYAWLVMAGAIVLILGFVFLKAFIKLSRLTRAAYASRRGHRAVSFVEFENSSDQIGLLGGALHGLIKEIDSEHAVQEERLCAGAGHS